MNHCIRFLVAILTLTAFAAVRAQDSTFVMTEAFRIYATEDGVPHCAQKCDLDRDGVDEIILSLYRPIGRDEWEHSFWILKNGELFFHSAQEYDYIKHLFFSDYNRDGATDVVLWTRFSFLEAYYAPEFRKELDEREYYYGEGFGAGGDRILPDGDRIPLAVTNGSHNYSYESPDTSWLEMWTYGSVYQGTWLEDRPRKVAEICRPTSFVLRDNGLTGSDLFAAGYDFLILDFADDSTAIRLEDYYFQLFTNYGREFGEPDSLTLCFGDTEQEPPIYKQFGFSYYSAVDDFDGDGRLDWAQPHWTWETPHNEMEPEDTIFVHLAVYDPLALELVREYVEPVTDVEVPGNMAPTPILGVAAVDINRDGVWELLLAIQGRPLRIIDSRSMELIMSSEFVLPDVENDYFLVGRFQEDEGLQILLYNLDERALIVYNLPEDWEAPNEATPAPLLTPTTFALEPAWPNPFNAATRIAYDLPEAATVDLAAFNTLGQRVETLFAGDRQAGRYQAVWTARDVPSGVYFIRLTTPDAKLTSKVLLVR